MKALWGCGAALIGLLIIMLLAFAYLQYSSTPAPKASKAEIPAMVNGVESGRLIDIAKDYLMRRPGVYHENTQLLNWSDEEAKIGSELDADWIVSHQPTVQYFPTDKDLAKQYEYLKGKYRVGWFFIPGCEESKTQIGSPNWVDGYGRQCLGGYSLGVLIDEKEGPERAILMALN